LYSDTPASDLTFIISDFFFHNNSFQTTDSFDILAGVVKISASVEPTILYSVFSFEDKSSIVTIFQIVIFPFKLASAFIISTFFNCQTKSEILFSTAACSFLASSYSEFSDKSQKEIASFNFSAISTLFSSCKYFNSSCNFCNHSCVTNILSAIFFF
jgi:hypothetical protein